MPTYRPNPTDANQNVLEDIQSQGGILVETIDANQRVIIRELGGVEKVQHAVIPGSSTNIIKNAGVSMPWDDKPGRFVENSVGKA